MTTLRQMGAKIGSRVRFIEDPEGQWRTVKTDAELDYEHLLPWVVEDNTRIEELEAKLEAALHDADEAEAYAWELEQRLAKAVKAAEQLASDAVPCACSDCLEARATLAELKGQGDE